MRSFVVAAAVCLIANACNGQSLTVVDSEAFCGLYILIGDIGGGGGEGYEYSDTDETEVAIGGYAGGPLYLSPSGGWITFGAELEANVTTDGMDYVEVYGRSSQDRWWRGVLDIGIDDSQGARAQARVQAESANLIDDVEVKVTFYGGMNSGGAVQNWPSAMHFIHYAEDEYFGGVASGNNAWYPDYPTWSSEVPLEEPDPWVELAIHLDFNLIVESGSEIFIRSQAGHANMAHGVSVPLPYLTYPANYTSDYNSYAGTAIQLVP